jgi:hypothetical protein
VSGGKVGLLVSPDKSPLGGDHPPLAAAAPAWRAASIDPVVAFRND